MTERKSVNDYDIIAFAVSLVQSQFQKEDNIFVAQCIWWLASIAQYSEKLKYYLEYQVFPSNYLKDSIFRPLPWQADHENINPDSDFPLQNVDSNSDIEDSSSQEELQTKTLLKK